MKREFGFTLIEVLITVAIVAILASIAYPSYQDSIKKSRRAEAQNALQGLAQAMERHYTSEGTYASADGNDSDITSAKAPAIFPAEAPLDSGQKTYDLRIISADRSSYTIQAIPKDPGPQKGDGLLELKDTGERGWDRNGSKAIDGDEKCWSKSC